MYSARPVIIDNFPHKRTILAYRLRFASTDVVLNGLYTRYSTTQSDGMDHLHRKMAALLYILYT